MTNRPDPPRGPAARCCGHRATRAPGVTAGDGDSTAERRTGRCEAQAGSESGGSRGHGHGEGHGLRARPAGPRQQPPEPRRPSPRDPGERLRARRRRRAAAPRLPRAARGRVEPHAWDKIEVVLLTILSLLTLALPYSRASGMLPTTWTVHTTHGPSAWPTRVRAARARLPRGRRRGRRRPRRRVGRGARRRARPQPARSSRRSRARASSGRRTRTARSPTGGSRRSSRSRRSSPSPCCSR